MEEIIVIYKQLFSAIPHVADILRYVWFFILPPFLYKVFYIVWMDYANDVYLSNTPSDMLEIIPPHNTERSPQPMESVFAGLEGTSAYIPAYDELCMGVMPPTFNFEIVGTNGNVHFYVLLERRFRSVFESHFYAQYPDAEIHEARDYTGDVPAIVPNKNWDLWGADITLIKPDPIPIKTWQYFEEDITGKMIDPMAGLIEVMGHTRKAEHLWFQIIAEPMPESWHDQEGMAYVEELKGRKPAPKKGLIARFMMAITGFLSPGGDGSSASGEADAPLEFRLSPGEKKVLEAIEENVGRYMFKVKMRMIYLARTEVFDKGLVAGFFGALKQFADFNLNAFKPYEPSITYALYVARKIRLRFRQHKILYSYRKRKMSGVKFVLSDRELATIYHMPDMSVVAPAIARSNITKSTAPANLPIPDDSLFDNK